MREYGSYWYLPDRSLADPDFFEAQKIRSLHESLRVEISSGISLGPIDLRWHIHSPFYRPSLTSLRDARMSEKDIEDVLSWAATVPSWPIFRDSFAWVAKTMDACAR